MIDPLTHANGFFDAEDVLAMQVGTDILCVELGIALRGSNAVINYDQTDVATAILRARSLGAADVTDLVKVARSSLGIRLHDYGSAAESGRHSGFADRA